MFLRMEHESKEEKNEQKVDNENKKQNWKGGADKYVYLFEVQ